MVHLIMNHWILGCTIVTHTHNIYIHIFILYIYVHIYIYEPFGSRSFNIAMEAMADRKFPDSGLLIAWDRTRKHMDFIRKYGSLPSGNLTWLLNMAIFSGISH